MSRRPTARRFTLVAVVLVALIALTGLTGCWEGSVLSLEEEWAEGVNTYFLSARGIADRFMAADQVILDLADKAQAGEEITEDDLSAAYQANTDMTAADQDWLELTVPDPDIYDAHLAIEESMRAIRKADKELVLAIESNNMPKVAESNTLRADAVVVVEDSLAEMEAWYDDNERRINRGLN